MEIYLLRSYYKIGGNKRDLRYGNGNLGAYNRFVKKAKLSIFEQVKTTDEKKELTPHVCALRSYNNEYFIACGCANSYTSQGTFITYGGFIHKEKLSVIQTLSMAANFNAVHSMEVWKDMTITVSSSGIIYVGKLSPTSPLKPMVQLAGVGAASSPFSQKGGSLTCNMYTGVDAKQGCFYFMDPKMKLIRFELSQFDDTFFEPKPAVAKKEPESVEPVYDDGGNMLSQNVVPIKSEPKVANVVFEVVIENVTDFCLGEKDIYCSDSKGGLIKVQKKDKSKLKHSTGEAVNNARFGALAANRKYLYGVSGGSLYLFETFRLKMLKSIDMGITECEYIYLFNFKNRVTFLAASNANQAIGVYASYGSRLVPIANNSDYWKSKPFENMNGRAFGLSFEEKTSKLYLNGEFFFICVSQLTW